MLTFNNNWSQMLTNVENVDKFQHMLANVNKYYKI